MTNVVPRASVLAAKRRLGALEFLEFGSLDVVTAHKKLGEQVMAQVHRVLCRKLDKIETDELIEGIRLARRCDLAITHRVKSPGIDHRLAAALLTYRASLKAWSEGAQIEAFKHDRLIGLKVDGHRVTSEELAFLLQNDNTGCQTGVIRDNNGDVILWHSEEDVEKYPGARFDKLRIARFRTQHGAEGHDIYAFIYPDLLPGPAFGWRSDHYVQAVDGLFIGSEVENGSMLANIAAWLALWMGKTMGASQIIESIGPFFDGYAFTIVQTEAGEVTAKKTEFVAHEKLELTLPTVAGEYLFQVNIFSREASHMGAKYEQIKRGSRKQFEKRVARTERALRKLDTSNLNISTFFDLLCLREGEEYAYANGDVKAHFVAKVSEKTVELWIGAGPALTGELPVVLKSLH